MASELLRRPEKNFSDKITLNYVNQIEAFHVSVREGGGGGRKTHNFCLSWKDL